MQAAFHGDSEIFRTLLSLPGAQSCIDYQDDDGGLLSGSTILHVAASKGSVSITEQLIALRCNVDLQMEDGQTPLISAAVKGHAA